MQQQTQIVEQTEKLNQLNGRAERLEAEKLSLETRIAEQLKESEKLNDRFKAEFKVLA